MRWVYPPEGHETFEQSTFLIGSVLSGHELLVNGEAVPVSPEGFFAWKVPLQAGENGFVLQSRHEGRVEAKLQRTFLQKSPKAIERLPEAPSELFPYIFPHEDLGVQPGETLTLLCPAPPGSRVLCRVDWLMSRYVEMNRLESVPENLEGVFARLHQVSEPWPKADYFMAQIHIPANTAPRPNLLVQFAIHWQDQKLEFRSSGSVTILPLGKRPVAKVMTEEAVFRFSRNSGARRTPLLAGTLLELNGFYGDAFRARLGTDEVGWIDRKDIEIGDNSPFPALIPVSLIQCETTPRGFQLVIPLNRLLPVDIRLESYQLTLSFYGAVSACDFIHYFPGVFEQGLAEIQWRQKNSEVFEVFVKLASPLRGVQRYYDAGRQAFVCSVRTEASIEAFPVVLVLDPGHGGDEPGSIAPDGTPEKDLNLNLALKLRDALANVPDLAVVLTRETDVSISLAERIEIAKTAEASLMLSLHHNALPDGRNPLEEQGVSTYYYHPFALPVARQLQSALVQHTDFEDYGLLYDSLYLCRVMEMPSLLLELGFLTHPHDAALCLDKAHQERVVTAICQVVRDYVARALC